MRGERRREDTKRRRSGWENVKESDKEVGGEGDVGDQVSYTTITPFYRFRAYLLPMNNTMTHQTTKYTNTRARWLLRGILVPIIRKVHSHTSHSRFIITMSISRYQK